MSAVREAVQREGRAIRVRGLVQGVGFRPTVWRLARDCGLSGDVRNDAEGVMIRAWGEPAALDRFLLRLRGEPPPLARIDALEANALEGQDKNRDFRIVGSHAGQVRTGVVPDAATCAACLEDVFDRSNRRYRYPFTNCTHCGPRLTIVRGIPYDRARTSMAGFAMCADCRAEYENPGDRRFHAQPNACPECGPRVQLMRMDGRVIDPDALGAVDEIEAASRLLARGEIIAIKGLGGFHLACDAGNPRVVASLRARKHRYGKPFALLARDIDVIRRHCGASAAEAALLASSAAPIVLLRADGAERVAEAVAPGQGTLG
ncbi:MAG: acylphosphatase, partial [Rhodanobacteraceae bacterium]